MKKAINALRKSITLYPDRYVSIILSIFVFLCFNPGFLSPDPLNSLRQARTGVYSDWHPPVMAVVWRFFEFFQQGPGGMLFFHHMMFAFGTYFWSRVISSSRRLAIFFILVFTLFPSIFSFLGMVWKDVSMGTALLLTTGMIAYGGKFKKKSYLYGCFPFLFFGYAVRLNSLPAILPIMLWWGWIYLQIHQKKLRVSWVKASALGLAGFFAIFASTSIFNRSMVQGNKTYPAQMIMLFDLAAMTALTEKFLLPEEVKRLHPEASVEWAKKNYFEKLPDAIWILSDDTKLNIRTQEEFDGLRDRWVNALQDYPMQYLKHRWRVYKELLRVGGANYEAYAFNSDFLHPLGHVLIKYYAPYCDFFRISVIFGSGNYLIMIFVFLALLTFLRVKNLLTYWVMGLSGISYHLVYFFISSGGVFRYAWWTAVVAVLLGIAWLMAIWHRVKTGRSYP